MSIDQRVEEIMSEYRFLQMLTTPWKKLPAYKLGIIDEHGKVLRNRRDLTELHEKQAYPDVFYTLCWNVKRLVEQYMSKARDTDGLIKSIWTLKSKYGGLNPQKYETHIREYFGKHNVSLNSIKNSSNLLGDFKSIGEVFGIALYRVDGKILTINELKKVTEDGAAVAAPANNVGGGQMAGVSPGQEPPMPKSIKTTQKRKKIQRRQQDRIQKDIQTLNIIDPKK